MIQKSELQAIVDDYLSNTNYYLVDLNITTNNCIVVEIDSFDGVDIDFCVKLNRYIESCFDRDVEDYELEVCSAGLTEPFKVLMQYEKNIGNEVEVLVKSGEKKTGILSTVNNDGFEIEIEKMEKPEGAKRKIKVKEKIKYSFEEVKSTKYIYRFK